MGDRPKMTDAEAKEVLRRMGTDLTHRDRLRLHLRDDEETWHAPLMEDVLDEMDDLYFAARHYRERAERAEQELRCIRGWVESDWALDCADRPTARAVIAMYAKLNGDARQAEQERDDYRDGAAAEAHEGDRARQEAAELRAEVERLTAALAHAVEQIAQAAIDCQATEEIAAVLQAQVVGLTSRLDADHA